MNTMYLLVFVFAVAITATNGSPEGLGAENPDAAIITKYPYQAQLVISGRFQCGGSIISDEYILTTAHCVASYLTCHLHEMKVQIGTSHLMAGGMLYDVSEGFVHPKYNGSTSFDVAVLRIKEKMVINNGTTKVVKLAASGSSLLPGEFVKISGWGKINDKGPYYKVLQSDLLQVLNPLICEGHFPTEFNENMFCAGLHQVNRVICPSDSGGAAVHVGSDEQYGVVSWVSGCAMKETSGLYASVPAAREWITSITGI